MSISPKLSHSTPHTRDRAWAERHEARRLAHPVLVRLMSAYTWQLKFVVRSHHVELLQQDLEEIDTLVNRLAIPATTRDRVFLMPECIDRERLAHAYAALVPACVSTGFRLGERLHIHVFGHTRGT